MGSKERVLLSVVLFVAIVGLVYAYYLLSPGFFLPRENQLPQIPSITIPQEKEITPPPATGNVDDAANAMLQELSDEGTLLSEEESDTELIISDSQEISDFGQSVNENEF